MASRTLTVPVCCLLFAACNNDPPQGACAAQGVTLASRFEGGSKDGHADPTGAKAAGQARAGRVRDPANIKHQDRIVISCWSMIGDIIELSFRVP